MGKYGKTMSDSYQEVLEWTITAQELQEKKKVSKREIDKLEDGNEHGMVALKLAQSFGTPKEVKTVQDINKRHQRAGSIEYKDQKERDAIIRKYYNMAEVYEIGTKEYADHTKNMTPGQTVDEGRMKDIVTDVKDALGKIRHRVSQKGSKFIVSVDSNDEEDAQKAMKNHPLYVAGKLRVIPEETELDEALSPQDKKVIDTFYHTDKSMTGKMLKTDGKTLEKMGMGAQTIAKVIPQSGGEFKVVAKMDGRSTQEIVNYIKKTFPKQLVTYEEVELGEKKQLKPNAKFDFDLFSDMKGAKEANAELNKELHKAVRMKDKKSAVAHMRKIQNKYMKFGATDTEPSMTIGTVLDAIFENKEIAELKKRIELDEAKFQVNYSKNNKLYSKTINAKDEDDAEEKAIKKFKIDDDDIRSVVKEALDEVTMTKALNIDPKDVDRMKVLAVLYTRALKLPSGSPLQDKIKKEITKLRKQLGMNEAIEQKLDEMFDYVLLDKDNKIVGRYSGKDAKKNAQSDKNSAHLPPMRIPKGEVSKMKVYPISPKDKKGIGDMVLAIGEEVKLTEKIEYVEYKFKNSRDASSAKSYFDGIQLMKFDVNDDNISNGELMVDAGNKDMTKYHKEVMKKFRPKVMVQEKKLTDAEMKKREEIAKAIEKDDPDMPMDKKMAIATATAKRVAEEEEPDKPDTAKKVDQMRDDKKKTRIAQLQLQIAKATETINKLNTQEK